MFRLHVSFITALNKRITRLLKVCAHIKPPSPGLQVIRGTHPGPDLVWIHQRTSDSFISTTSCIQGLHNDSKALMEGDASSVHVGKPSVSMKLRKVKRNLRKVRGRKQKQKEKATDSTVKLLAELPFTGTEVWKELGFSESDQTNRKRKERGQAEAEDGEKEEKKKTKGEPRPNYFVSIPITNQKIKQGVEEVQAQVLQKEPRLSRALIPVGSLHITLLVTHLATQEEVDIASLAVEGMESTLTSLLGGRSLVLPFRGVGHFRQEVGFVQIEEGEHLGVLAHIAGSVRRAFEEKGIPTGDQKAFKPHLTLIKLSKAPRLRRQGIKKLDLALFSGFEQRVFGEESVCSLDLCSMLKKKGADGYYHSERTVTFDLVQSARRTSRTSGKRGAELDDDELVSLSKRLVEDAVSRAVQQYMEETQQNGTAPKDEAPPTGLKK